MTDSSAATPSRPASILFAGLACFAAVLVFWLEPLMGRALLPALGGAPAAWGACLAFFQVALLAGYLYAHGLQRIGSARLQGLVHAAALALGALVLFIGPFGQLGAPDAAHPAAWALLSLVGAVGLPFALLSASGPLLQAWMARGAAARPDPYWLYAASSAGALVAVLAYPIAIQPILDIQQENISFKATYIIFLISIIGVAAGPWLRRAAEPATQPAPLGRMARIGRWWRRFIWLCLAAAPASLLVGVSAFISGEISAGPLVWAAPMALYLASLALGFQRRPLLPWPVAVATQAAAVLLALAVWTLPGAWTWLKVGTHLTAFFFTALLCHHGLAQRRPPAARLTEFYLVIALGGAVGGAATALAAPLVLPDAAEYPLVLLLAGLARPWGTGRSRPLGLGLLGVGLAAAVVAAFAHHLSAPRLIEVGALGLACLMGLALRERARAFLALTTVLWLAGLQMGPAQQVLASRRDLFGVTRVVSQVVPGPGRVRVLSQGATLQGAQFADPGYACTPAAYEAPTTPIGQVLRWDQQRRPALNIGVIGMGAGAAAAYVRPGDRLRFFELDPAMVRLATTPAYFSYVRDCAHGPVDWVLGDGRLSLSREPDGAYDLLLVDAFVGGALPAHLMTVEAVRAYLAKLKPDGVLILHVSNRSLELTSPAAAAAHAAGGFALRQFYRPPAGAPRYYDIAEDVVLVARNPKVLEGLAADPRWRLAEAGGVAPWTDDYADLIGAALRGLGHNRAEARAFAGDLTRAPLVAAPPPSDGPAAPDADAASAD